jgi:hypothetical protein
MRRINALMNPPPNLSLSRMQASAKRSPRRRYTRRRPSGQKRMNRDSSVKKTRLHCLVSKATTSCFAIWCECFHHRVSCRCLRDTERVADRPRWGRPCVTTRATCTSERKTNVRSTSSQTKLTQSVSHSFWVNVPIMIAYPFLRGIGLEVARLWSGEGYLTG